MAKVVVDNRPIEEVLAEIAAEVPDDAWANVPTDLCSNLDYYLYGTEGEPEAKAADKVGR